MTGRPRVLVTGSSGRVGSAIAAALSMAHDVTGLDLSPGPQTTHHGSIEDAGLVAAAMRGAVAVVHTAALHAPHVGRHSDAEFRSVNVDGTRRLLDTAVEQGARHFIYTSSTSIYGHALEPGDQTVWVTEELEPRPRDIYDETKLQAEALCREAASGTMSCLSLRISRCFPEPGHLLATYRLYRGVDLQDVAEAHRLALGHAASGFEVFNISAQSPFLRADCGRLLADAPGVLRGRVPGIEAAYGRRGWTLPTSIDRIYVIDKAVKTLGYCPRFNFAELLATLA
jgi:nucleoside-diphosphate-sugar epimerase